MIERVITLLDGPHKIHSPGFLGLDLMSDDGLFLLNVTPEQREAMKDMQPSRSLAIMLAAMLTEAEPDIDGVPVKRWTYQAVQRLIPVDREAIAKLDAITGELMREAVVKKGPDEADTGTKVDTRPPTKGRSRGSTKPSARPSDSTNG